MKRNSKRISLLVLILVLLQVFDLNAFAYGPNDPEVLAAQQARSGETGSETAYDGTVGAADGLVEPDPIFGMLPDVHVQMKTGDGNFTDGFTTNMEMFNSPLEGFSGLYCRLENGIGDVFYRVYTEEHGWSRWAMNEMNTDWHNDAAKVTAVQLRIQGYTRSLYDLYYRVELNDGTLLDWAHDGQTAGTIGTGKYIQKMQVKLWKHGMKFCENTRTHLENSGVEGIVFLEADGGKASYSTANGALFTGWGYDTDNNKYYFRDSVALTGWQYLSGYKYYFDETGRMVTDLEPILGKQPKYLIKVNKPMKTMMIYADDGDGNFSIPYKVFLCTIGSATPTGQYKLYEPHRWKFMHDDIYVQYLLRYKDQGFCIHSIIYRPTEGSYNLVASTYNQLGKNYSDGCIRLLSGDAAWLYENCGAGTELLIYENEWVMGPFDRPAIVNAIPDSQRWDPTDPVVIQDQEQHTGPFASGTYDGTGFETPLPETAEEKAKQDALTEGAAVQNAAGTEQGVQEVTGENQSLQEGSAVDQSTQNTAADELIKQFGPAAGT